MERDGPGPGSTLPRLSFATFNGYGTIDTDTLRQQGRRLLLVFLSITCQSCQTLVEPLNALAQGGEDDNMQVVVALRGDEQGCASFHSVFPLRVPATCDGAGAIGKRLGVHRNPFGLLYDEEGKFDRKSVLLGSEELQALVGKVPAA